MTSTVSETERPLRADARRNRERILQSARAAFAESGADAQIDDVARHAGVGVGTALEEQRNGEWRYLEFLQVTS